MPDEGPPADFDGEYVEFDDPDGGIGQGDILDLVTTGAPDDDWGSYFGVVVTANCDLVHRKHGGVLSYVPVVPVHAYARAVTIPRMVTASVQQCRSQISDAVPEGAGWPSADRLVEMIEIGVGVDAAIASLPSGDSAEDVALELRRLQECLDAHTACEGVGSIEEGIEIVDKMSASLREIEGRKPLKLESLLKDLAGRLTRTLPGDALFLGHLSPNVTSGYVAYLRLIREIRHDAIATSAVAEGRMTEPPAARRVGRLGLVYQHRLAQQLARVFSDIGLPEPYEENWSEVITTHTERWGEAVYARSMEPEGKAMPT